MREYDVANKEKPLLLTLGLQSCIALFAWNKDFSFLSHMNVCTCYPDFYVVDIVKMMGASENIARLVEIEK